jgi:hypothetical protein
MDRIRAGPLRGLKDAVDIEVTLGRRSGADGPRLVSEADVAGPCIDLRIHGRHFHSEPVRRARDTAGNLAAVRDQQLMKHDPMLTAARRTQAEP